MNKTIILTSCKGGHLLYYYLHSHCHLVKGAARGAIYDLSRNKVYSINKRAVELLSSCKDVPIESILTAAGHNSEQNEQEKLFFDELTNKNLGGYYFFPLESCSEEKDLASPKLDFVWLELTKQCNHQCLHCYTSSNPQTTDNQISLQRWLSLIGELKHNGATGLQFIGGEPLLYSHWRTLVLKAHQQKFDFIEIFTNATRITDDDIRFFSEHNVHIATTIFADNAEIHDEITRSPGSFDKTVHAIKKLLSHRIPLRIASIIMRNNEDQAEPIMKFCNDLGIEALPPDVIRPTGRGKNDKLLPLHYQKPPIQPPFYVNETEFHLAKHYNPCLAGKIAITSEGDVLPCIFSRDYVIGNILEQSVQDIVASSALQKCWALNKDKMPKCKDCEYRYACPDCKIFSSTDVTTYIAGDDCSYQPLLGTWAK